MRRRSTPAPICAGSKILQDCYARASAKLASEKDPLHAAFSCYYSGNFSRGFRPDKAGQPSYVQKVLASAGVVPKAIPVVPAIGARTSPTAHLPAAEPAQPGDATAAVPLTAAPAQASRRSRPTTPQCWSISIRRSGRRCPSRLPRRWLMMR